MVEGEYLNGRATDKRRWGKINTSTVFRRGDKGEKDQSDPALEGSREDVREGINRTGSEEGVLGLSTKSDIGCEIENSVSDVTVTELEPLKKKKGEDGKAGSGCV